MNVFLTIAGLSPEFGGPSRSVPALAEALARENAEVNLISCESLEGQSPPILPNRELVGTRLLSVQSRQGRWRATGNDFFRALTKTAAGNDSVIHDNGLWLPTNHAVARAARFLKRPLIISPRGMLSLWERRHHAWKKKIAWILFQRSDSFSATALHATSEQEATAFREVGYRGPIAIVPNGVEVPEQRAGGEGPGARSQEQRARGREQKGGARIALCVTRLHPKKGLLDLIDAWTEVRPSGWRMIIAGSDEDGHRAELEAAIAARGLTDAFMFAGAANAAQKQALYDEADLFILPSHSENFGMSIAEALATGLPVITTRGTPWKDLTDNNCGWWVEIGAVAISQALNEATTLNDDVLRWMGERGRELVAQKYSWSRVAKEMKSVYEWLLGQAEQPDCVLTT